MFLINKKNIGCNKPVISMLTFLSCQLLFLKIKLLDTSTNFSTVYHQTKLSIISFKNQTIPIPYILLQTHRITQTTIVKINKVFSFAIVNTKTFPLAGFINKVFNVI